MKIDKKRDVLIAEKVKGETILKGSKIFCGCCGKSIGKMKQDINAPFYYSTFRNGINNLSLQSMPFGFRHSKCGHTMFSFKNALKFMTLKNYKKSVKMLDK